MKLSEIIQELRAVGAESVMVHYDGEGGDGVVEFDGVTPRTVKVAPRFQGQIADWAADRLPDGWPDSDGSCGTVEIDVVAGKAVLHHSWRVMELDVQPEQELT